jgi:hypothetical protein
MKAKLFALAAGLDPIAIATEEMAQMTDAELCAGPLEWSTRRTMSSGSTSTAKSGTFSTSSLIRVSNFTFPTIPTLSPKLRKVPRRSFSIAMVFD